MQQFGAWRSTIQILILAILIFFCHILLSFAILMLFISRVCLLLKALDFNGHCYLWVAPRERQSLSCCPVVTMSGSVKHDCSAGIVKITNLLPVIINNVREEVNMAKPKFITTFGTDEGRWEMTVVGECYRVWNHLWYIWPVSEKGKLITWTEFSMNMSLKSYFCFKNSF